MGIVSRSIKGVQGHDTARSRDTRDQPPLGHQQRVPMGKGINKGAKGSTTTSEIIIASPWANASSGSKDMIQVRSRIQEIKHPRTPSSRPHGQRHHQRVQEIKHGQSRPPHPRCDQPGKPKIMFLCVKPFGHGQRTLMKVP